MKTVLRIVIILIAAAVITGITLAVVDATDASASLESSGEGFGGRYQESGENSSGELPTGEVPRRGLGGGRHNASLEGEFSGIETIRNFVIVTLLVSIVALIEFLSRKARKRRRQLVNPSFPGEGKTG